jgi:hypothetical protein
MQTNTRRCAAFVIAAFALSAAWPAVSEAAFARRLSGRLGSNPSMSTQQLTGDPASIQMGSMSTEYEPDKVSLIELLPGPTFDVTALIGIRLDGDAPGTERFVSDSAYFAGLPYSFAETGYIQVSFFRQGDVTGQSLIDFREGYQLVDEDGPGGGDDTHALFFDVLDPNAIPVYHIYREDGTKHDVAPDYLTTINGETFTTDITDATVSGAVPEPTFAGVGLTMLAGLALRRRAR